MQGDVQIGGSLSGTLTAALFGDISIGDLAHGAAGYGGDLTGTISMTGAGPGGNVAIAGSDSGTVIPNRNVPATWASWVVNGW